jgi:Tol biopolymer transport system component
MISIKYKLTIITVIVWLFVLGSYPLLLEPDNYGKIAFISSRDCDREIYVMDADGKNIRGITDNFVDDLNPAWSPDGLMVAFFGKRSSSSQTEMVVTKSL